jgi:hypothetical protein
MDDHALYGMELRLLLYETIRETASEALHILVSFHPEELERIEAFGALPPCQRFDKMLMYP